MSHDDASSRPSADVHARLMHGRRAFRDAVCVAVETMAAQGHVACWWVDADFADWPLDDPRVLAALADWARPGRRLTLLATHFDAITRGHPRFVAWRRLHAHLVTGRAVALEPSSMPTLLLGPVGCGLQRLDSQRSTSRWLDDADVWQSLKEVTDALMQQSCEAFPAYGLGL